MAINKNKPLTRREAKFLKAIVKGDSLADAALYAGYSEKYLRQSGFQAMQRIQEKMPQILDRKGLTDEAVIDKYLRPALEANETEFAKFNGKIMDEREVVAWTPRLNALDMLFKLKGSYAKTDQTNIQIPVQFVTNIQMPGVK